jgi:hypothetical protein
MEGERKHVTVLFTDISDFTSMSEKMDPETVMDIINECFSMMGNLRLAKGFDRYDILLRFVCERAYAFAEKGVIFNDVQSNKNQECGNP